MLIPSQLSVKQNSPAILRLTVSEYQKVHILKQYGNAQEIVTDLAIKKTIFEQPQLFELPAYASYPDKCFSGEKIPHSKSDDSV